MPDLTKDQPQHGHCNSNVTKGNLIPSIPSLKLKGFKHILPHHAWSLKLRPFVKDRSGAIHLLLRKTSVCECVQHKMCMKIKNQEPYCFCLVNKVQLHSLLVYSKKEESALISTKAKELLKFTKVCRPHKGSSTSRIQGGVSGKR